MGGNTVSVTHITLSLRAVIAGLVLERLDCCFPCSYRQMPLFFRLLLNQKVHRCLLTCCTLGLSLSVRVYRLDFVLLLLLLSVCMRD